MMTTATIATKAILISLEIFISNNPYYIYNV